VLDHRLGTTEAEALQGTVDEESDTLTGDLLAVGEVVLEAGVTELRDGFADEIIFPTPKQLTQLHSGLLYAFTGCGITVLDLAMTGH
jgi:hypothetical protein